MLGVVTSEDDQAVVNSIAGGDAISKVSINGDTTDLMAKTQSKVDEWNKILG